MKTKTFLTKILILCCLIGLSLNSIGADKIVTVKDVEYLTGSDFVQLHFKIDRMIPIPDVFYPDKSNNTLIIMRISNVAFQLGKDLLTFNSGIIDSVKIDSGKSYTDVEIKLKEQVNYRVFTNRKGLYIEFPQVKKILAEAAQSNLPPPTKSPASVKPQTKDNALAKSQPAVMQTTRTAAAPTPPNKPEEQADDDKRAFIKDIVVSKKDKDSIKFNIVLSRSADFYVIPIPDDPARLAIDFKNTDSRRVQKIVDQLNVKKIRGAYNSSSIYRLVFDLHYLKNYKVSPITKNGNVVEVAFFNSSSAAKRDLTAANQALPKSETPAADNTPNKKEKKKKRKKTAPVPSPEELAASLKIKTDAADNASTPPNHLPADNENAQESQATQSQATQSPGNSNIVVSRNADGIELRDIRSQEGEKQLRNSIQAVTPSEDLTQSSPAPIRTNSQIRETAVEDDFFGDEKSEIDQNPPQESSKSATINYMAQTVSGKKIYTGVAMGFNFHNADLKDVIKIIAKISHLNIIMDPGISGRITSQLDNVPWDQALDLFLKINSLGMIQEGNILRIGTVARLSSESAERKKLRDAQQSEEELEVYTKTLSFAKVDEVNGILQKQLSPRGEILKDPRTNTLIISDIPQKIIELKKLIKILDTANPQVSIEARIVETKTNYIESFGIQWGYKFLAHPSTGNQTTLKFPNDVQAYGNQFSSTSSPLLGPLGGYAVNLPASGATAGTVFSLGNVADTLRLDMALTAMQSDGHGRIISAPKTTTQNNMEASIMQGKQIPVQTIQNNTVTVVYRPAALELKVTPQITADGTVITSLEIKNNSADFGNLVNGIPPIETQTIKTTVMVPDGGTIVIGGMYKVEKTTTNFGVPILSKIPLLGNLFKSSTKRNEQRELLVFITPRIIK